MICPICKREVKDDSKFCGICGKKIPRCPTCGKVLYRRSRFCVFDGTSIPEEILNLFPDERQSAAAVDEARTVSEIAERFCLKCGKPCDNEQGICGVCQGTVAGQKPPKKITVEARTAPHRFCVKCGKPCNTGEILCQDCKAGSIQEKRQMESFALKKKKKKKPILPIIFGVILLLFLLLGGVLAYFVFNGGLFSFSNEGDLEEYPVSSSEMVTDTTGDDENTEIDALNGEESAVKMEDEVETEDTETEDAFSETSTEDTENSETHEETEETVSEEENDPVLYFIMNSDNRYFTEDDIKNFDADMCRLARNGIYAWMGRKFNDNTLTEYFSQYDWYNPTIDPDNFTESILNAYQIANRDLIVNFEKEQGYR